VRPLGPAAPVAPVGPFVPEEAIHQNSTWLEAAQAWGKPETLIR
jgi:hypothetical protein